jgi:hypothetical protein
MIYSPVLLYYHIMPRKRIPKEKIEEELKDKLAAKDRELGECRREARLPKIYITRDIAEGEAECLSKKLKRIVRRDEICEKAQDIIRHPSEYAHLFHKPDLPPYLDPDSAENARADGNDANGIDSSDNSDPLNLPSDRTKD